MWVKRVVVILLMMGSAQTFAAAVDLRLSDKSAEFTYLFQNSTFYSGGADVGASFFYNTDDDLMLSVSWLVSGPGLEQVEGLSYGIGIKGYALSIDKPEQDGGAFALGGQLRYRLPGQLPIAIVAEGFISPKITSFSDIENIVELRTAAEFEINQGTKAYVGYRSLEADLNKDSNYELDASLHVGVRLSF